MAEDRRDGGPGCSVPLDFPKRANNRPGLDHIQYRIGTYSAFREYLMRRLNEAPELLSWTHRESDDPGIALLEGAAALSDVLTFYQDLYANEALLRTARWRSSVGLLAQLLGYRPTPGLGGYGTFAFEVKDGDPVTLPAGLSLKIDLEDAGTSTFETLADLEAYPSLNRLTLCRPLAMGSLGSATQLCLFPAGGADLPEIAEDDRILVATGVKSGELEGAQILIVEEVSSFHGTTMVTFRGTLPAVSSGGGLLAYKLGRTFRYFGHNAPKQEVTISGNEVTATTVGVNLSLSSEIPLDVAVDDLAAGGRVVCEFSTVLIKARRAEGRKGKSLESAGPSRTMLYSVTQVKTESRTFGSLVGSSTVLTVNVRGTPSEGDRVNIRRFVIYEVLGDSFKVAAKPVDRSGSVGSELWCFGDTADFTTLEDRKLALVYPDGTSEVATARFEAVTGFPVPLSGACKAELDIEVDYADFPQEPGEDDAVVVYGNVVDADQGKTETEAAIGSGDARATFQTFALPKNPLTYHYVAEDSPPHVPELEILVGGRLWRRVDTLYGQGPSAEVFVVREDSEGNSWAQFGDGRRFGSRLPSGVDNVTARYRTGTGAYGAAAPGAKVQPARVEGLDKSYLAGVVSGGSDPADADATRAAAPGRVQSLGRLVGLSDFESEAAAIAGVVRASADWDLVDHVPSVVVTVLLEAGREREFGSIESNLRSAARDRGADRFEICVVEGEFEYVLVEAEITLIPGAQESDVRSAVDAALGVERSEGGRSTGGLFSLGRRKFGQPEYGTRVTGVIQNVPGVAWTRLVYFQGLGTSDDPETLGLPATMRLDPQVPCSANRVLRLYDRLESSPYRLTFLSPAGGGAS